MRRLKILTWHVHGNYLYYLSQVPHDFHLVTGAVGDSVHAGRTGTLPWGANVHEVPAQQVRDQAFDVILYQSRGAWEQERELLLSPPQRLLPRIYLEHDPPQQHPTNTRHWVDDPDTLLVHVTHFNALMWDSGRTPVRVIEHGVKPLADARYGGGKEQGVVVVNNLERRGRRLGLDVYQRVARDIPMVLVGMGAERVGGLGEIANHLLPAFMADYRFFFNPIRYTSLGLSVIEAMLAGLPVVGLATTELPTVIRNGENGYVDTDLDRLVAAMRRLLAEPGHARELGAAARRTAAERFGIGRFVADWTATLRQVAG